MCERVCVGVSSCLPKVLCNGGGGGGNTCYLSNDQRHQSIHLPPLGHSLKVTQCTSGGRGLVCVCVLKTPSSVCLYVSAVDQYSQSLIAPRIIGTDQWGDCMSGHTWTTLLLLLFLFLFLSTEDTLLVTALDDCLGSGSSNSSSHRAGRLIEKPRRNGRWKEGRKDARMQFGKEVDASGNGNGNGNWRQDKWLSINLLTVM